MEARVVGSITLEPVDAYRWRIPRDQQPGMGAEGVVYLSDAMVQSSLTEPELKQVANVACLPGLQGPSMAMPDIHFGYGFPIGGVAATDAEAGVVSPGGVGYDINCGVRLLRTDLTRAEIEPVLDRLLHQISRDVPSGVGSEVRDKLAKTDLERIAVRGARWAVERGFGTADDLDVTEENGALDAADPHAVSARAVERGLKQVGTLGSGNHFLEIQVVDEIYDGVAAAAMGLHEPGQITVLIHTGSRGYGYQICDDSLELMQRAVAKYKISLPDRQLACAPVSSTEGTHYLSAMACAANFAWANRQMIAHRVRGAFERLLGKSADVLGMRQVYDVAHNIAKIEEHPVRGAVRKLCVHRKGATRAFAPHTPGVPACYQEIGQPVLVPGDMGRHSFVLVGTETAMWETWGSTCHGAGRLLSRAAAMKLRTGHEVIAHMRDRGVLVVTPNKKGVAEEQPEAYKDVADVVDVVHGAGLSTKVARMRPLGVVKG